MKAEPSVSAYIRALDPNLSQDERIRARREAAKSANPEVEAELARLKEEMRGEVPPTRESPLESTFEARIEAYIAEYERRHPAETEETAQAAATRGAIGERNSRVIPQDVKIAVALRDQGKCVECGATEDLHYDHKVPWSRGGTNTINNIQLLCGRCNRHKGGREPPLSTTS